MIDDLGDLSGVSFWPPQSPLCPGSEALTVGICTASYKPASAYVSTDQLLVGPLSTALGLAPVALETPIHD